MSGVCSSFRTGDSNITIFRKKGVVISNFFVTETNYAFLKTLFPIIEMNYSNTRTQMNPQFQWALSVVVLPTFSITPCIHCFMQNLKIRVLPRP